MLKWCGKNSMCILCIHKLEMDLIDYQNFNVIIVIILKITIAVIGTATISLIKNRFINKGDVK